MIYFLEQNSSIIFFYFFYVIYTKFEKKGRFEIFFLKSGIFDDFFFYVPKVQISIQMKGDPMKWR